MRRPGFGCGSICGESSASTCGNKYIWSFSLFLFLRPSTVPPKLCASCSRLLTVSQTCRCPSSSAFRHLFTTNWGGGARSGSKWALTQAHSPLLLISIDILWLHTCQMKLHRPTRATRRNHRPIPPMRRPPTGRRSCLIAAGQNGTSCERKNA